MSEGERRVPTPSVRVTIADVAAAAGVARGTVSQALNDKGRVDPNTRARIKAIAESIGYRPNVQAQRLRGGRSGSIALITTLPASIVGGASRLEFFLELALPIAQACIEHRYTLILVPPVGDRSQLDALDVDGAIVVDPVNGDEICRDLVRRGVRVVTIGDPGDVIVDGVIERGDGGAAVAMDHLRARGAHRIAVLVSSEGHSISRAVSSYLAAERASAAIEISAPSVGGEEAGYAAAVQLLAEHPDVDAIYAPIDAFALGASRAVLESGRRIPQDVMIATNYDGRRAATASPPLTALDLNLPRLAQESVGLLMSVLDGAGGSSVQAPTPTLRTRESTNRQLAD